MRYNQSKRQRQNLQAHCFQKDNLREKFQHLLLAVSYKRKSKQYFPVARKPTFVASYSYFQQHNLCSPVDCTPGLCNNCEVRSPPPHLHAQTVHLTHLRGDIISAQTLSIGNQLRLKHISIRWRLYLVGKAVRLSPFTSR